MNMNTNTDPIADSETDANKVVDITMKPKMNTDM